MTKVKERCENARDTSKTCKILLLVGSGIDIVEFKKSAFLFSKLTHKLQKIHHILSRFNGYIPQYIA